MAPTPRGIVPSDHRSRLRAAVAGLKAAKQELRDAVVSALVHDASVREVFKVSGVSTTTIQKWGHEAGWPTKKQLDRQFERRRVRNEFDAALRGAEEIMKGRNGPVE